LKIIKFIEFGSFGKLEFFKTKIQSSETIKNLISLFAKKVSVENDPVLKMIQSTRPGQIFVSQILKLFVNMKQGVFTLNRNCANHCSFMLGLRWILKTEDLTDSETIIQTVRIRTRSAYSSDWSGLRNPRKKERLVHVGSHIYGQDEFAGIPLDQN